MSVIVEADKIPSNREKPITWTRRAKVYIIFILQSLLPASLLGFIFLLVARSPSLLGLVAMFATVVLLRRHSSTFWRESFKTIGMLTQLFVLVTYTMDFFTYLIADRYSWFVIQ